MRVFVSHSHRDNAWVELFVAELIRLGANVWFDKAGLYAGIQWVRTLEQEIEKREVFAVVLSHASMNSWWVQEEFYLALRQGKLIVGILLEQTELHGFIGNRQVYDATSQTPEQAAKGVYQALTAVEGTALGRPHASSGDVDFFGGADPFALQRQPEPLPHGGGRDIQPATPPAKRQRSDEEAFDYCTIVRDSVDALDTIGPNAHLITVEYYRAVKAVDGKREIIASEAKSPSESEESARRRLARRLMDDGWQEVPRTDVMVQGFQFRRARTGAGMELFPY